MTAKGSTRYVLNLTFDNMAGEIVDQKLELDLEKITEQEKYDGYFPS